MSRESMKRQLSELSTALRARADACHGCGADWDGSTYLAVLKDGTSEPRCIVCEAAREMPQSTAMLKAYPAGLPALL